MILRIPDPISVFAGFEISVGLESEEQHLGYGIGGKVGAHFGHRPNLSDLNSMPQLLILYLRASFCELESFICGFQFPLDGLWHTPPQCSCGCHASELGARCGTWTATKAAASSAETQT